MIFQIRYLIKYYLDYKILNKKSISRWIIDKKRKNFRRFHKYFINTQICLCKYTFSHTYAYRYFMINISACKSVGIFTIYAKNNIVIVKASFCI